MGGIEVENKRHITNPRNNLRKERPMAQMEEEMC